MLTSAGPRKFVRLVEGALQVLRGLDKEVRAAKGFRHPVLAGPVDQRVRLHVEHRVFRDFRHTGPIELKT
jgi:hypothetical protein